MGISIIVENKVGVVGIVGKVNVGPTRPNLNQKGGKVTREEHMQWCKDRALEFCDNNDLANAWASMASDLTKHEETKNHLALELGTMLMLTGKLNTQQKMRKFIVGFN